MNSFTIHTGEEAVQIGVQGRAKLAIFVIATTHRSEHSQPWSYCLAGETKQTAFHVWGRICLVRPALILQWGGKRRGNSTGYAQARFRSHSQMQHGGYGTPHGF